FGRVWEARAGGIDEPVIGAHAGGYNSVSTGIAVLGTFMSSLPSAATMDALERLMAWKLSLHGVPSGGQVRVQVSRGGWFYTPFSAGQLVRLPRIAGHRDGDMTDCPGNDLYAQLPRLRPRVGAMSRTARRLTLAASAAAVHPTTPVLLSGRLATLAGAPVAGAPLALQTIAGAGHVATFATATTAADGSWSAGWQPARSAVVRALCVGPPAAVSDVVTVGLIPTVTLTLQSASPLRVAGSVTPAARRVTISAYRLAGRHRRLALTRQVTVRRGAFTARLSLGRRAPRAEYELVARTMADAELAAGASAPLTVTV
ncbi:MAG: peptidoglycan recognition protein family protein, partial [Solirubrobacteraceae bacterium]